MKISCVIIPSIAVLILVTVSVILISGNTRKPDDAFNIYGEIELSSPLLKGNMSLEETISARRSKRVYTIENMTEKELSMILWSAQGVTGEGGLRSAPSAGALYPLEIYVSVEKVLGIEKGLYKYFPENHSILNIGTENLRQEIYEAALNQESIKDAAVVLIYTAVFERTISKYGNRADRYVYIEAGHSSQNVYLQATALNLGTTAIGAFDDKKIKDVLNLPKEEDPIYIMPLGKIGP